MIQTGRPYALGSSATSDCIPVVRYGAAQAPFRVLSQRAPVDASLDDVLRLGWILEWQAVDRQHNTGAHALAQYAARWANELRHEGSLPIKIHLLWRNLDNDLRPDFPMLLVHR